MIAAIEDLSKPTADSPVCLEIVLDRVGGDMDLLREITAIFLDEYPALLSEIRSAVQTGNPVLLETAAHTLKGSVANFGAEDATQAAYALEKAGRQREMQGTGVGLAVLETEFARLRPALLTWTA